MRLPTRIATREAIMWDTMSFSWAGLLALGAFHGVNPGMGWLFAVALGMQERRRSAVCRAMLPLALGHGLAIAAVIAVAVLMGAVIPLRAIQWVVSGVLLALGISRFFRHGHPRWVGMQVGMRDLTVWSFLMASAHGAGLMVLPLVLTAAAGPHHAHHAAAAAGVISGLGNHRPQRRLPRRECGRRARRVREAGRGIVAKGVVQPRSGVGRCVGGDQRCKRGHRVARQHFQVSRCTLNFTL